MGPASMTVLDCQRCGACCCNPDDNRAEGFRYDVEVQADIWLLRRPHRDRGAPDHGIGRSASALHSACWKTGPFQPLGGRPLEV